MASKRVTYAEVEHIYTQAHERLASVMNSDIEGITLYEVGQLYLMVDKDVHTLWKRIEFLRDKLINL